MARYVSIWFRHLTTDWMIRRQPDLKDIPFVFAAPERGRKVIRAASAVAEAKGIEVGMVAADARAILPGLQVLDELPGQAAKLLSALAEWCLCYTPVVAVDLPDGLILEITGCAHLWKGEQAYLSDMLSRLRAFGYDVRAAMADTIGTAWAVARFEQVGPIIANGLQAEALRSLPPAALRLEPAVIERMQKLGFYQISGFMQLPRPALRRRFGQGLLTRLAQALGQEPEKIEPIQPVQPYQERLPSLEPIRTATGIEIALKKLLETLCLRLSREGNGLRSAIFKGYRIDGKIEQIAIGTTRATCNAGHLFKLFELKIATITPALGIELFLLEAPIVEEAPVAQDTLWKITGTGDDQEVTELLDRLAGKVGIHTIRRYLPDEHYWPERSIREAANLYEKPTTNWRDDRPRPLSLLPKPEVIEVTVPIPDYPPLLFRYKGQVHKVAKADGPERIEREWWLDAGKHRDYYCIEDEQGARYWLFRLGHYDDGDPQWFIHGFFA